MFYIIELLILFFIAFLIISKLLMTFGIIDDEDKYNAKVKKIINVIVENGKESKENQEKLNQYYAQFTDDSKLYKEIQRLENELPGFIFEAFVEKVKKVFHIVVTTKVTKEKKESDVNLFSKIVEKNSIDRIFQKIPNYQDKDLHLNSNLVEKIDILGNHTLITFNFKTSNINEFWTFRKDMNNPDPTWYLTEIN